MCRLFRAGPVLVGAELPVQTGRHHPLRKTGGRAGRIEPDDGVREGHVAPLADEDALLDGVVVDGQRERVAVGGRRGPQAIGGGGESLSHKERRRAVDASGRAELGLEGPAGHTGDEAVETELPPGRGGVLAGDREVDRVLAGAQRQAAEGDALAGVRLRRVAVVVGGGMPEAPREQVLEQHHGRGVLAVEARRAAIALGDDRGDLLVALGRGRRGIAVGEERAAHLVGRSVPDMIDDALPPEEVRAVHVHQPVAVVVGRQGEADRLVGFLSLGIEDDRLARRVAHLEAETLDHAADIGVERGLRVRVVGLVAELDPPAHGHGDHRREDGDGHEHLDQREALAHGHWPPRSVKRNRICSRSPAKRQT